MRSQISPATIQAAPDRQNYQNFLTYNFSLNEWSGLFHSFGAFAGLSVRDRAILVARGAAAEAAASLGSAVVSRVPVPAGPVRPRETFSVLIAAMPVAHVTLVARRRRCVTTIVAYFFNN